nr:paladin isoform X2 [Tanacetum cinerariifolium]
GINRARVEQMEDRLKEDILLEAARYGNKILVTDELPDGQMVDQWEPVTPESVKTPLQVYLELQKRQYLVDYERIPVTDEKSPKEQDFDTLVSFTYRFLAPIPYLHQFVIIYQCPFHYN